MEAAVRAGNEYLQLTATHNGGKATAGHTYQVTDENLSEEVAMLNDRVEFVWAAH